MKTPEEQARNITRRLWGDDADHLADALQIAAYIAQAIDNATPRWIPVAERLPEEKLYVLVLDENEDIYEAYIKDGYWIAPNGRNELIEGVTHWQFSPPPPVPTQEA